MRESVEGGGLGRVLDARSIAIVGLSSDSSKHGGRVLGHLRRLGYPGQIWGVNPKAPHVAGVQIFDSVVDLPERPDLVVAAVPAPAVPQVVADCAGVGGVIVFGAGFAETGTEGKALQDRLTATAREIGARLIGPSSGGVIRPARGLAASFLTCLDRPPGEIRSGPVGVVTQSGGVGSLLHNLAAARGEGLAVSVATGNEADVGLGEAIDAVATLDEVRVVLVVVETLRDGLAFSSAVRSVHDRGKRVVACRIGTSPRGQALAISHTGTMATPAGITAGVFSALGVMSAETPQEAYDIAAVVAGTARPSGPRVGVVTHSGGSAILLADLADRFGVVLPAPSRSLIDELAPFMDHGSAANPLDMGGIIGGPSRFADAVDRLGRSGECDVVLAVSTPHPPAHTSERVDSLLRLDLPVPVVHLWMAGDQTASGLTALRRAGAAVTEEPRAAMKALAGLVSPPKVSAENLSPVSGPIETWGVPLLAGVVAADSTEAVAAADEMGYPVAVKVSAPGLIHKTDVSGVKVDLRRREEVAAAFSDVVAQAEAAGWTDVRATVQRYRPGVEVIVGGLIDEEMGPLVSVGMGGVLTEVLGDVVFAPAPVGEEAARAMIDRLRGRRLLDGHRGGPPADVDELARLVGVVSRGLIGSEFTEVEINPLIWDGTDWNAVDWLAR